MSISHRGPILGGIFAFILSLSCCWLPALLIAIGSATGLVSFSEKLESYSGILMSLGAIMLAYGGYTFVKKRQKAPEIILQSNLTCPSCSYQKLETMPENACQYFYECENCKMILKPLEGDCCVYCSYGSVKCPPIQEGINCCD